VARPVDDAQGLVFVRALSSALVRAPIWLTVAFVTTLLALVVSVPWFGFFQQAMEHRYEPGSLIAVLDETFRFDHRAGREVLEEGTRSGVGVAAVLAMLVGVFSAGGWLQVFLEGAEGQSVRRFFFGGSRYFFRFLRVLFLTLLSLHLIGFCVYGLPWEYVVERWMLGVTDGDLEVLASGLEARRVVQVQDGLYVLAVALVLAWGDYTRTRLALHDTTSAAWAGLCAWATIIAHPVRTLRPLVLLLATEALLLAGVAWLSHGVQRNLGPDSGWGPLVVLIALGQLTLCWRTIVRGARYAATVRVSHQLVRPLARPNPWKKTIGGPGGPRYPVEDGEDFGVSL
jgi:hypothetical protein